jgi:hypothetical protein
MRREQFERYLYGVHQPFQEAFMLLRRRFVD